MSSLPTIVKRSLQICDHMKSKTRFKLLILLLGVALVSACGVGGSGAAGIANDTQAQPELPEPPEEYAALKNPLNSEPDVISAGEILFQANCASCHGAGGEGDGPAAAGLNPKPKILAQNQANLDDGYLYWRIAEGGLMEPFNSVMPAWKGMLDQEQIWKIITFIRTLD
jgi:mono/diheme cytochrome c family protein